MTEDDAITKYREQLTAEADLARGDLDEIEDHLRNLYNELRERMPHGDAIAEACRRLGDPRQLAREHARVRTPFGARLSRRRAWSAAVLLVPMAVQAVVSARHWGMASPAGIECGLVLFVMAALVGRLTWARPIIVGSLAATLVWNLTVALAMPIEMPHATLFLVSNLGALAFLVPWRRGELTPAAIGLALLAPAYSAAASSLWFYASSPDGVVVINPIGFLAALCVVLAGIGFVLRARWGAIPAAIAALSLVGVTNAFWPMDWRMPGGEAWRMLVLGNFMFGAATAAIAAVVCWRTARSKLGTLRHVLS
jgi:hypothetical protein